MLQANGNVYAAFTSFCDFAANYSRGWVLGWRTGTLTPLPANEIIDRQAEAQTLTTNYQNYYLSSMWMSGSAIASDGSGDLFFMTGNSNALRTNNLQEAVPTTGALALLYSAAAGPWPNVSVNANLVPVVANGEVYVAS